ncbi:hypothetical protein [Pseudoalteromonas denitrificans]|nr:hypothetical protein [Pseudoalteromonas denitrificans]
MDSCQFQNQSIQTSHMNMMSDMNHSMDEMDMGCCETEHLCSMNGCVSMAITANHYLSDVSLISQKIIQKNPILFSQYPSSLYRPPLKS